MSIAKGKADMCTHISIQAGNPLFGWQAQQKGRFCGHSRLSKATACFCQKKGKQQATTQSATGTGRLKKFSSPLSMASSTTAVSDPSQMKRDVKKTEEMLESNHDTQEP